MGRKIPTNHIDFKHPKEEMDKILNRLEQYPVLEVKPKAAQSFGRYTKIRYLSRNKCIFIKKGTISLPKQTKLIKINNGYSINYKIL